MTYSAIYRDWAWVAYYRVANPPTVDDYQCRVNLDYLHGMNSDFSDIRFTDLQGRELKYNRLSYTASTSAVVDVLLPNKNAAVLLYYGNPMAEDASDSSVYLAYFDGDSTGWTVVDPNNRFTFSDDRLNFNNLSRNEDAYVYLQNGDIANKNTIIEFAFRVWGFTNASDEGMFRVGVSDTLDDSDNLSNAYVGQVYPTDPYTKSQIYASGTRYEGSNTGTLSSGTTYYARLLRNGSAVTFKVFNDAERTNIKYTSVVTQSFDDDSLQYIYMVSAPSQSKIYNLDGWIKDYSVRQYLATEPTASIVTISPNLANSAYGYVPISTTSVLKTFEGSMDLLQSITHEAKSDIHYQDNLSGVSTILLSDSFVGASDIVCGKSVEGQAKIVLKQLFEAAADVLQGSIVAGQSDVLIKQALKGIADVQLKQSLEAPTSILYTLSGEAGSDIIYQQQFENSSDILSTMSVEGIADILYRSTIEGNANIIAPIPDRLVLSATLTARSGNGEMTTKSKNLGTLRLSTRQAVHRHL